MKKVKNFLKKLWQDESGQGATEYILLLVVVVAIAILFKDQIMSAVEGKLGDVTGQLSNFSAD